MRVVLATTALARGGVWRHVEDLGCELQRRGEDVVVALVGEAGPVRAAARAAGLPVADLERTVGWRRWLWHAHLHDTFDRRLAAATIVRRAIGPSVVTEHLPRTDASDGSLLCGRPRPLAGEAKTVFKRAQLRCTNAVIALSRSSAEFLTRRYGLGGRRADVIYNGIEPSPAPVAARAPHRTVRIVSVGSVIRQKGHDLLLEAAARSRRPWRVSVVGDGHLLGELARRARADALPVTFSGWSDDVAGVLAEADVACLPSRWESCPYAALEAMDAGLPLVGTDVDGLRELIEPGRTGLVVAPENPRALAEALDLLAGDPAMRRRMGEAARVRASSFTVARMAEETSAVYRRIVDQRAAGAVRSLWATID